jgi:hypothetical protein
MNVNTVARGVRFASTAVPAPGAGMNAIRTWGPVGAWLRDQPNLVPGTQKVFAASKEYTYKKTDKDKMIVTTAIGVTVVAVVLAARGM